MNYLRVTTILVFYFTSSHYAFMIPPNVRPAEPPRLPSLEDIQNIKTQNAKLNTVDNSIHNIGTRLKRENEEVIQACDEKDTQNSFIYCSGKLLESVMYHELYNDSKTYVDKPLRFDPNQTIADFLAKFPMDVKEIKKAELRQFVDQYFFEDGHELDDCILEDWTEHPAPLKNIQDNDLREWAYQLNGIWKDLCRKTKPDVYANPQRYSLIALPHEFIVPGQRFQESYYWDTYWIIKGLLRSNMTSTAKKMIQNFFHIVKTYGYVLNGNRYYYARRSQPPFLSFMVKDYFDATQDVDFLFEALPVLEKEMSWWEQNRMISVSVNHHDYDVFRFRADSNVPRPESYFQDVNTTSKITDLQEKHRVWRDISSAAESGWDFSSRWLRNTSDESSFDTSNIAPVDLNAILCGAYSIIGDLYEYIGYSLKSDDYKSKKEKFRETFSSVFWGANNTGWYDYHVDDKRHNTEFYPSNAVPLFTKCYGPMEEEHLVEIYSRMKSQGAFEYPGGVPSSLLTTGQQWDLPNGWSPSNHMLIEGLSNVNSAFLQQQAFNIAQRWILSNYQVYINTKAMFEKYDVYGKPGSGGEYVVQKGFGWTNGVILELLHKYSSKLNMTELEALCTTLYSQSSCQNLHMHVNAGAKQTYNQGYGFGIFSIALIWKLLNPLLF